jgi:hypothetical protein
LLDHKLLEKWIDNTNISAEDVAKMIKERFKL